MIGLEPGQPDYRILVVEDQLENRTLMSRMLKPIGFSVREAADGKEGIAVWKEWQPHLIWMDIRMPIMDGLEATQHIKATAQGQNTVIIALTASAFEENREAVLKAGCDDFVRKPFRKEELFDAMAQHLGAQFIYVGGHSITSTSPATPLTSATLNSLPPTWIAEVHQAASMADDEEIKKLLAELESQHTEIAAALNELVRNFRFDEIMLLTANSAKEAHV